MEIDLTPDVFTSDYTGSPGQRAFFLQARASETHTVRVEKAQVQLLAEKLGEMLIAIDQDDTIKATAPARDPGLEADPEEPEWRAGAIGLAYDEESDTIYVVLEELIPEDEPDAEEAGTLRVALRRDQVRAFVLHSLAVVGEGRPVCRLCGLPMDPAGHVCPASNGHHTRA